MFFGMGRRPVRKGAPFFVDGGSQCTWLLSVLCKSREETSQEDVMQVKAAFEQAGLPGLLLKRIDGAEKEVFDLLVHTDKEIVSIVEEFLAALRQSF